MLVSDLFILYHWIISLTYNFIYLTVWFEGKAEAGPGSWYVQWATRNAARPVLSPSGRLWCPFGGSFFGDGFLCRFLPLRSGGFLEYPQRAVYTMHAPSQARLPSPETGPRQLARGHLVPTNSLYDNIGFLPTQNNALSLLTTLSYLTDCTITSVSNGQVLKFRGTKWVISNDTDKLATFQTVQSVFLQTGNY